MPRDTSVSGEGASGAGTGADADLDAVLRLNTASDWIADASRWAEYGALDGAGEMFKALVTVTAAAMRARDLLASTQCPYFKGNGTCASGCYEEPSCMTDAPTEGWDAAAIKELSIALAPLDEVDPSARASSTDSAVDVSEEKPC